MNELMQERFLGYSFYNLVITEILYPDEEYLLPEFWVVLPQNQDYTSKRVLWRLAYQDGRSPETSDWLNLVNTKFSDDVQTVSQSPSAV